MAKQVSKTSRPAPAAPAVYTRLAVTPLERRGARLVGVRLVSDPHRVTSRWLEVGVRFSRISYTSDEQFLVVWSGVHWLDLRQYQGILSAEEATAWVASGFASAANDARF